jgi:hypothetical protein
VITYYREGKRMTFHEEMKAKQTAKDSKCKKRVYDYMDIGRKSTACQSCSYWQKAGFGMVCLKFGREVYLENKDKLAMSCY